MRNVISIVKKVLKSIDKRDYEIPKVTFVNDNFNVFNDSYSTYENNFVTKFNEKYALAEFKGEVQNLKELQKQLQITKRYIYSEHNDPKVELGYKKLTEAFGDKVEEGALEFNTIPDFFIHLDQTDKSSVNQKLIIEFKTEKYVSRERFMWDLFKLNVYLEKFKYQTGCFVCINNPKSRIEKFLTEYLLSDYYLSTRTNNLYILIQESYDAEISDFSVQSYIKKLEAATRR